MRQFAVFAALFADFVVKLQTHPILPLTKTKFAREVVPIIDKSISEVFRPMVEFLKSKCTPYS